MNEYAEVGMGHSSSVRRRFGSWFRALELAGLQPSRSKYGISNEELFDNIRGLWILLGRQPSYSEVKKPDSKYSAGTYEKRFGSWTKSLEAFVNWVNSDEDQELSTEKYSSDPIKQAKAPKKHRTRREVSDRMHFIRGWDAANSASPLVQNVLKNKQFARSIANLCNYIIITFRYAYFVRRSYGTFS